MVHIENIYYVAVVILSLLTILGMLKSTMVNKVKSLYRVMNRLEGTLDTIDSVQEDIEELDESVQENTRQINEVSREVSGLRGEVGGVKEALMATVMFENGDLDEEAILDDLDDTDPGVHRYFNENGSEEYHGPDT